MIKGIQRIKDLGIFSDYSRPAGTEDFVEKNILYGWNYAGKTTLSRLFQILERGELHPDFINVKFTLTCQDDSSITEANFKSSNKTVRVFNAEFVEKNLSWNGASFHPIVLLGEESIEAEKKIAKLAEVRERCRDSFKKKRELIAEIESVISDEKSRVAKKIKTTLRLVEAFTAHHLQSVLSMMALDGHDYRIGEEDIPNLLKLCLASESDKLLAVPPLSAVTALNSLHAKTITLLAKKPSFSNTIEYLENHPATANWVERGLPLHEHGEACQFCGNAVSHERLAQLHAHFSKDLTSYKQELSAFIDLLGNRRLNVEEIPLTRVYSQFREDLANANGEVITSRDRYNAELSNLVSALQLKHQSPFAEVELPSITPSIEQEITEALSKVNDLLTRSNAITVNFDKEKRAALSALKFHYAAEYYFESKVALRERKISRYKVHLEKYGSFGKSVNTKIAELEAMINLAQKGREEINRRISDLLGSNSLRINVVDELGHDRFSLYRGDLKAKNLSEGEKTAIAFAFFLTKLREIKNIEDAIIYIDDPISSLDSNHIFQVNSIIKSEFFFKDAAHGDEWKTRCKQIFISTHNFEFFSLLRELPCSQKKTRYFQVKRLTPERSALTNLPKSIEKYSSEYHYLFGVLYGYHNSPDKTDLEILLAIPNAVRRFLELYTYAKIPSTVKNSVDDRADLLFGAEKSKRILKVLHYFSHANNIERIAKNTDLICDVESAVNDLIEHVKSDTLHFNALMESVQ